ncbi:HTH-type transcriptional repressor GlcR [compost metagenome]
MVGGKLRPSSGNIIDTLALDMISKFTLDLSFLTGGGVSANGISTATPEGASFTRILSDISRKRICLAPHEKVGIRMFATSIPIERLDLIITDHGAPNKIIQEIESRNVKVIIAEEDDLIGGNSNEMD